MLQKSLTLGLLLAAMTSLSSCKKVVDKFSLDLGDNSVTTAVNFVPEFGLNVDRTVDIVVKGVKYGSVSISSPQNGEPFKIALTAELEMFLPEVWEGFAPTNTLPNGEALPNWIQPNELIAVDVPNFNEHVDLTVYVGFKNPYYVGVALSLKILDGRYPEGLGLSQAFRKNNKTWGQGMVYGPTYEDDGSVRSHGGLFFVAGFSKGQKGKILLNNFKKSDAQLIKLH